MTTPPPAPTPPASTPIPVTLVGGTGLTGSAALSSLLASPAAFAITSLSRRAAPASPAPSANPATSYHNRVGELTPVPQPLATKGGIFVSCLGTTRAAEGGVDAQRKIDLDLNRDLAEQARKDGADTVSRRE